MPYREIENTLAVMIPLAIRRMVQGFAIASAPTPPPPPPPLPAPIPRLSAEEEMLRLVAPCSDCEVMHSTVDRSTLYTARCRVTKLRRGIQVTDLEWATALSAYDVYARILDGLSCSSCGWSVPG